MPLCERIYSTVILQPRGTISTERFLWLDWTVSFKSSPEVSTSHWGHWDEDSPVVRKRESPSLAHFYSGLRYSLWTRLPVDWTGSQWPAYLKAWKRSSRKEA